MKRLIVLLPLFTYLACMAQSYEYLGTVDGLSDRRVYAITEDPKEHLWFLNNNGVDRYDGEKFKHYKTIANNKTINYSSTQSRLYTDPKGSVWVVSETGQLFRYNYLLDSYQLMAELPQQGLPNFSLSCSYLDRQGNIWMCASGEQYIYQTPTKKLIRVQSNRSGRIISMVQTADNNYYVSTSSGIYRAILQNNILRIIARPSSYLSFDTIELIYYHPATNKLILCSRSKGIYVYDIQHRQISKPCTELKGVRIIRIRDFENYHLLIATDGAGIYNMDINTCTLNSYIVADYTQPNKMNGNHINDVLIDKNKRIWVANYPIGITMVNYEQTEYSWIKHSLGNKQSLVDNQINCVI
ncbi:MAG: hybrid sensor histidine kinase/response regulator, partial [Bacteroidaceae bacterium]